MHALILAGGRGTRLRPLTVYTPKPVVPLMNRPFLLYQIEILAKAGVTDITFSLSYQPDKIEDVLGGQDALGVQLHFITEPSPLGTAGAYRFAGDGISETTIVLNGDVLTDLNVSDLLAFHRERSSEATIVLTPVADPSAYGLVEVEPDGSIKQFLEKPKPEELKNISFNTINAGIYVLEPSIMELIPKGENSSFEYNVFPAILEKKIPFHAFTWNGYWRDIGTPESYLAAHHDFLDKKIDALAASKSNVAPDIATAAFVDAVSVIGSGSVIKPGASVTRSTLGPGVQIEEKAVVDNSVIWAHTRVSSGAEIRGSIIGRSCHIGRNSSVRAGGVLGDKTTLPDYSRT